MPREPSYSCTACEQAFGSKWALLDHGKHCPVQSDAELARVQDALAWRQRRIESNLDQCYRYGARAFSAHHSQRSEEADRFRDWFVQEYQQAVDELEQLSSGLMEASRIHFPRMERMKREVGTLIEQAQDLASIHQAMNRILGENRSLIGQKE